MKNRLQLFWYKIQLSFNPLTLPINRYLRYLKRKLMDKTLTELLQSLTAVKHEKISDVQLQGDKLFFRYLGGRFFVIKVLFSKYPNVGYLTVYHETPFAKDNMRPVEGFFIVVDKFGHAEITNHSNSPTSAVLQAITQSATVPVLRDNVAEAFVKHFEGKMLNTNFEINLIN